MTGTREPEMIEIKKLGTNLKKSVNNNNNNNTNNNNTNNNNNNNTNNNNNNGLFHILLASLKEKLSVVNIRTSTLHLIIKYVMEEIEDTHIKGSEQKEFALRLIKELVIDLTDDEDEKVLLQLIDDGTIANMIDLIVDATRGKLNVNSLAKVGSGLFNRCIPYCLKSNKK
jgi:hypothetical protein